MFHVKLFQTNNPVPYYRWYCIPYIFVCLIFAQARLPENILITKYLRFMVHVHTNKLSVLYDRFCRLPSASFHSSAPLYLSFMLSVVLGKLRYMCDVKVYNTCISHTRSLWSLNSYDEELLDFSILYIGYSNAGLQSLQAEQRYTHFCTQLWSYGIIGDLYKALLPLIPKLGPYVFMM